VGDPTQWAFSGSPIAFFLKRTPKAQTQELHFKGRAALRQCLAFWPEIGVTSGEFDQTLFGGEFWMGR
jgi:hypothetical protein